jgi:hypothetical protein
LLTIYPLPTPTKKREKGVEGEVHTSGKKGDRREK